MKLIDILVRELPKRGCWPVGVDNITQYKCGGLCFNSFDGCCIDACPDISLEPHEDGFPDWAYGVKVTREQYEAALASSKPEWDGEGLPPVGCECELSNTVEFYTHSGSTDFDEGTAVIVGGTVNFGLGDFVAVKVKGTNCITDINPCFLRPIRSEADKKRDAAIEELVRLIGISPESAAICYDVSLRMADK